MITIKSMSKKITGLYPDLLSGVNNEEGNTHVLMFFKKILHIFTC